MAEEGVVVEQEGVVGVGEAAVADMEIIKVLVFWYCPGD